MSEVNDLDRFSAELQQLMPMFIGAMIRRERNAVSQGIITLPQFLGLSFLRAHPSSPVKSFAETLGQPLSSASGLLDRLAKLGLLERTHSQEDRRVVLLTLTPKGERMVDEIAEQKKASIALIFSALTPSERTSYLRLMRKVVKDIQ